VEVVARFPVLGDGLPFGSLRLLGHAGVDNLALKRVLASPGSNRSAPTSIRLDGSATPRPAISNAVP
jgi:hypothetical protein